MKKQLSFASCVAIMAMTLATGCSRDKDVYQPTKAEIMANVEERLGVSIDPALDWSMTSQGRACITVGGNYEETYTVKIYSNDPLREKKGYVLKKGEVKSGEKFITEFDYPSANEWLVVGITDKRGFTSYKWVKVEDGLLVATVGSMAQTAQSRGPRKSRSAASVPHIGTVPTSEYARSFLEGAQEPNGQNTTDNYKQWVEATPETYQVGAFTVDENSLSGADKDWYIEKVRPFTWWQHDIYGTSDHNAAWEVLVGWIKEAGHTDWLVTVPATEGHWNKGANYTDHFKITGTYDNTISVLASEGDFARTVYVSGKWTIPQMQTQRVGGGAVVVVDSGGEIVLPEGAGITFVNEARLIVMPGGKITGDGTLLVTNGNAEGKESYNGGEINVGKFNNNFGKFFNYGKLFAKEYAAGARESNIYNHGLAHIGGAGSKYYSEAANARIFNACQWYCDNDMRAFIVENTQGSYFYVGGTLVMSDGTDGTGETSYVSLASGALMRMGKLYNNNCEWIGPTTGGYAVVEIGQVEFLNWTGDNTIERGKFINNIAITVDDKTNNCQGHSQDNAYSVLTQTVANYQGVAFVEQYGSTMVVARDSEFVAGQSGCTPGYQGVGGGVVEEQPTVTPDPDPATPETSNVEADVPAVWTYAFEDTPQGDYDMNDVVIKVREIQEAGSPDELEITLCCVGATFDLYIYLGSQKLFGGLEAHKVLGQPSGALVNTGIGAAVALQSTRIEKPAGFSFATADFWIDSPAVPGGVHVARDGEDPHGVAIPADWQWPRESAGIKDVYPSFVLFAADVLKADENARQWYKPTDNNPVADKIISLQ